MVMAVDIERRLPLDWVVTGKGMGETKAREWLLDTIAIQPGDMAVLDRGYTEKRSQNLTTSSDLRFSPLVALIDLEIAGLFLRSARLASGKKSASSDLCQF